MTRARLNMEVNEEAKVFTDIFIHGDELWRLQKTFYFNNGQCDTESIDFTKEEYENLFGKLPDTVDLS